MNKVKNDKYSIRNILGYQKSNDEFYTSEETVKKLIKVLKLPKNTTIWCPFDMQESEFVRQFSKKYNVIASHLENGQDFYKYSPKRKWNLIISNPPFSKKRLLIERCMKFNKPFCLLYGTTIFSQSMGNTLNKLEFWFIQNNCKFKSKDGSIKSFQCCWVMSKNFKNKYFRKMKGA